MRGETAIATRVDEVQQTGATNMLQQGGARTTAQGEYIITPHTPIKTCPHIDAPNARVIDLRLTIMTKLET